jgi:broad specificity polyphosphatase/5'/3'-nucleotidase SurE
MTDITSKASSHKKFITGTDDWALSKNKVSITPLSLDATNYNEIKNTISQELNK